MSAPKEILELVERFEHNLEAYRSGLYNETQLRREFLDPFWKALGWDIDNEQGYAEAYKDVIHEDAIRIGKATKAPDYCFRIGGTRKFFLEAKKPSVDIKGEPGPAYQLRRYAWSAKLPLSVLSDFEELAVYDGRVKPRSADSAATARVFFCTFREYSEKWDYLASIFSRDSVLKGSFDKYAESNKAKKGTAAFDEDFLATIEGWRLELARNLALRNARLSQRELNFAVQRIIDRIIFLRICEDRGIEDYGRLQALTNGERIYPRLGQIFAEADTRYNSGLFHFKKEQNRHEAPDEFTLGLDIDDKLLRDILRSLYYPDSPYEFSVISADILGQVYEQFLGKVIRLTEGHRALVEDKPEVKKAGGVYYTPTYIVDYIVRQTVGKLVEGKTPKQVERMRVLDAACGSGSFLIGAYQFLLDWHRDWYLASTPEKWAKGSRPVLCQTTTGWKLTISERKRILLNNIYGVDIDPQAVEVTKLSLLLKVLEGETQQSLQPLLRLFQERALPDLGDNIKCGNSLIGPDFYHGQMNLIDDGQRLRVNAFDWRAEFPHIFQRKTATDELRETAASPLDYTTPGMPLHGAYGYKKVKFKKAESPPLRMEPEWEGGFDAVIGNPPYVRQESLADFKEYFRTHYEAFDGVADLYTYFMEKGIKLLREGGLFSIIVSSSFLRATYGEPLRRTLKKHAAVLRIVDFGGLAVFANAKDTYVCIPLLEKGGKQARLEVSKVLSLKNLKLAEHVASSHFFIPHERFTQEAWALKPNEEAAVFKKIMNAGKPLGNYVQAKMFYGLKTGLNEAFEITAAQKSAIIRASSASRSLVKRFLGGQDIRRYRIEQEERFLIVIPCGWTQRQLVKKGIGSGQAAEREAWAWLQKMHPGIANHLEVFTDALKKRQDQGDYWWEFRPCDYYDHLEAPKIIFPDICKAPRFFLDMEGIYLANTAYCLGTEDRYLLGLLDSRLFWFAISNISIPFGIRAGEYRYRLIYQYMEKVPIRVLDLSTVSDRAAHDRMVSLVEQILALHRQLSAARTPHEQTALERQISATDTQIDRLVYDLYGLTEDEVKIIEGTHQP